MRCAGSPHPPLHARRSLALPRGAGEGEITSAQLAQTWSLCDLLATPCQLLDHHIEPLEHVGVGRRSTRTPSGPRSSSRCCSSMRRSSPLVRRLLPTPALQPIPPPPRGGGLVRIARRAGVGAARDAVNALVAESRDTAQIDLAKRAHPVRFSSRRRADSRPSSPPSASGRDGRSAGGARRAPRSRARGA
jgi:hypothetical protein